MKEGQEGMGLKVVDKLALNHSTDTLFNTRRYFIMRPRYGMSGMVDSELVLMTACG